jgi:hypothetical protein
MNCEKCRTLFQDERCMLRLQIDSAKENLVEQITGSIITNPEATKCSDLGIQEIKKSGYNPVVCKSIIGYNANKKTQKEG